MPLKFATVGILTVSILFLIACSSPEETSPSPFTGTNAQQTLPAFGDIDVSVKDNVGVMAPRPTDEEIGIACQALKNADWSYMSLGMGTDGRSMMIAASITTFASGRQLVGYCESKMDPDQLFKYSSTGCDDLLGAFVGAIFDLSPNVARVELDTFKVEPWSLSERTRTMSMDVVTIGVTGTEGAAIASGQLDIDTCTWNYRSVMGKPSN